MKKAEVNLMTPLALLKKMSPNRKYDDLTEEEKLQLAEEALKMLNITAQN